jgi:AraC family transcriptional regulator
MPTAKKQSRTADILAAHFDLIGRDVPKPLSIFRIIYPVGKCTLPPAKVFEIRIVRNGSSRALIDLGAGPRQMLTRPGDVMVSFPTKGTSFEILDQREVTIIRIDPKTANRFLKTLDTAGIDILAPLLEASFRDPMISELGLRLEASAPIGPELGNGAIAVLLHSLYQRAKKQKSHKQSLQFDSATKALIEATIEQNLEDAITVEQLSDAVQMPRRNFAAAFRDSYKVPVYQFVIRRRAEQAKHLIETSSGALADVAAQAGFANQAHMTRTFSKLFGRSPARFRTKFVTKKKMSTREELIGADTRN